MLRLSLARFGEDGEFSMISLGNERGDYRFYEHVLAARNYERRDGKQKPNRDIIRPLDFDYLENWVHVAHGVPVSSRPRLLAILDILKSYDDFWLVIERA